MFTGLSSLTKLVITGFKQLTRIVSLPATLEHIDLSDNCFFMIAPDAFCISNKLKYLNLEKNYLTAEKTFPAFARLAYLEHLSLQDNMIDSLEVLKVIYMPRLRVLYLYSNRVAKLAKQTFTNLPGLVNLDLSNNQIEEIEVGAFDGLTNLRVLRLCENKHETFHFNVFESAANKISTPVNLRFLSLNGESIKSVQWSQETMMLMGENKQKANESEMLDAHAAATLFAKCGFRNKLEIRTDSYDMIEKPEWCFLNKLELGNFVRL
jgi:Leucine-rich repeat (LRR) protein